MSVFPQTKYGPLDYRYLDNDKTVAFTSSFPLQRYQCKVNRSYCGGGIDSVFNHIKTPPIKFKMYTGEEQALHIDVNEILTLYFLNVRQGFSFSVFSASSGVCINHMDSSKSQEWNALASTIWEIWLTAIHISGVDNVDTDQESCKEYSDSNWQLNPKLLDQPVIFVFSSLILIVSLTLNAQLPEYVSFRLDFFEKFTDAFTLNWNWFKPYICP